MNEILASIVRWKIHHDRFGDSYTQGFLPNGPSAGSGAAGQFINVFTILYISSLA